MNINPFAIQAPDSVESVLDNAAATCVRFNHGRGLFAGHYMAAGRTDGIVAIWIVETRGLLRFLEGHVKVVTSVSWSPCSRFLASSSLDWNVIVWDLARRDGNERMHTLRFDAPVASVHFSPASSSQLVVVLQTQQLYLIDLRRRRRAMKTQESAGNGSIGAPSNHASEGQGSLRIEESRHELRLVSEDDDGASSSTSAGIISATFSSDGRAVVAGTSKGEIVVFDAKRRMLIQRFNLGSSGVRELAFDKDGKTLIANLNDRSIRLMTYSADQDASDEWSVNFTPTHRFQDLINRTPWSGIGFSGDKEYAYAGAIHKAAHNIYIWDRGAGVLDKILSGPRDSLITCDWHPSRPMIASVSHTGAVNIWFTPPTEIWSAYAPGFEELEENVIYQEREDEFDLEDEEEATRRKQDEEGAHVDIISVGPQKRAQPLVPIPLRAPKNRPSMVHDRGANEGDTLGNGSLSTDHEQTHESAGDVEKMLKEDKISLDDSYAGDLVWTDEDDEDEGFAIPVRLSLDLPDLEGEN